MHSKNGIMHRNHWRKEKVLRLLTFLCFFNFSGVHNGYTVVREISPVNFSGSVTAVGKSVRVLGRLFVPSRDCSPLAAMHELTIRFTDWAPRAAESAWRNFSAGSAIFSRVDRVREKAFDAFKNNLQTLQRVEYLKEFREVWNKGKGETAFHPRADRLRSRTEILKDAYGLRENEMAFIHILPFIFMAGFFMMRFLGGGEGFPDFKSAVRAHNL